MITTNAEIVKDAINSGMATPLHGKSQTTIAIADRSNNAVPKTTERGG